jgi:hypothetical protein
VSKSLELPIEESRSHVTIREAVEIALARHAELEKVAAELLDEANQLQKRVQNLRTQAHRIRTVLKTDAAGRE